MGAVVIYGWGGGRRKNGWVTKNWAWLGWGEIKNRKEKGWVKNF